MAVNQISMPINYRKNKSTTLSSAGKYYAEVDRQKTLSTRGLAQHLKEHNCMVGRDAIMAVLVKLSECVPELVAQGVGVKLDGLGTFYPSVLNAKGGATEVQMKDKNFNPTSIIEGVRIRFTPEATELDNLTSKQFLSRVSPASQNIVDVVRRVVNGKRIKVQTLVSLEDFRNPESDDSNENGGGNPSSGSNGSGGSNENENENQNENQGGSSQSGSSGSQSGSQNSGSSDSSGKPTISGIANFQTSTTVTITGPEGATIRYTNDGSTPTATSGEIYSEPFTLNDSATIKAVAVVDGVASEVTTRVFTKSSGD